MKVLQINAYGNFSTGKIAQGIALECNSSNIENLFLYGRNECANPSVNSKKIASSFSCKFHFLMSRVFDRTGFYSYFQTKKIVKEIQKYHPDIIHLHIIHGYYCNIKVLFKYLANCGVPIIWTFHDCWAYTGHCAYYLSAKCYKWKTQCNRCTEKMTYPRSFVFSQSKRNFIDKKKLFTSIKNLTIVANCDWLKSETLDSFFKDYKVIAINNGVDQNVFKYNQEARYKLFGETKKTIVLTIANKWDIRKGLLDVIEVYKKLDSDRFTFVVVGLTPEDWRLYNYDVPESFIVVNRTSNQKELSDYYSSADYFLCLSHEDTCPTTIIESISCGTPVLTYSIGGCSEAIVDGITGKTFLENDTDAIACFLSRLPAFKRKECIDIGKKYDSKKCFAKYIDLYRDSLKNS